MKYADRFVGAFVVGFCLIAFVGFTVEAVQALFAFDVSGLSK